MTEHYFAVSVMPLQQLQNAVVVVGRLRFSELRMIHRLNERKESVIDPFDEESKKFLDATEEEFQRQLRPNKLNEITEFLRANMELYQKNIDSAAIAEQALGIFPTSILLGLDFEDTEQIDEQTLDASYSPKSSVCYLNKNKTKLYIPKNRGIALIVDGQHRFYGVKQFYDSLTEEKDRELINEFEFPTSFLLGLDMYELGKVFAMVNFKQKPVNRSLYYDIFGSVPDTERNEIKLAHDLALHLNNNKHSPVHNMIKMLGKGYGLFSQAFIVEKFLNHFKRGGVWEGIYGDYLEGGTKYTLLPTFMIAYLQAIHDAYSESWPRQVTKEEKKVYSSYDYHHILCKTTGMGAMLLLIKELYPRVAAYDAETMQKELLRILQHIPKDEATRLFARDGTYGGAGGAGLQVKLYRQLKVKLGL